MIFRGERLVRFHVIQTDAPHLGAGLVQLDDVVAEGAHLGGATGCEILWVEIQHQPLALGVCQRVPMAILILQSEIWRRLAVCWTIAGDGRRRRGESGDWQECYEKHHEQASHIVTSG